MSQKTHISLKSLFKFFTLDRGENGVLWNIESFAAFFEIPKADLLRIMKDPNWSDSMYAIQSLPCNEIDQDNLDEDDSDDSESYGSEPEIDDNHPRIDNYSKILQISRAYAKRHIDLSKTEVPLEYCPDLGISPAVSEWKRDCPRGYLFLLNRFVKMINLKEIQVYGSRGEMVNVDRVIQSPNICLSEEMELDAINMSFLDGEMKYLIRFHCPEFGLVSHSYVYGALPSEIYYCGKLNADEFSIITDIVRILKKDPEARLRVIGGVCLSDMALEIMMFDTLNFPQDVMSECQGKFFTDPEGLRLASLHARALVNNLCFPYESPPNHNLEDKEIHENLVVTVQLMKRIERYPAMWSYLEFAMKDAVSIRKSKEFSRSSECGIL